VIIIENGIKIIIGVIGMLTSCILMIYFFKFNKKKQAVNNDSERVDLQGNNVLISADANYDTTDLSVNNSDDTTLLDEENSNDTTMLN
jgi:AICAR transformylase/IMP cyclohydrolase PurH